jgi:hypothetical protein
MTGKYILLPKLSRRKREKLEITGMDRVSAVKQSLARGKWPT